MSGFAPNPQRAAENALWHALEERRDEIRAAKLSFSERQHHQLREAHAADRLIATLCNWMENYDSARSDPYYKKPVAQAIKHGLETWEHVFIRPNQPWTPYVTPRARRGAKQCVADAQAYIPYL